MASEEQTFSLSRKREKPTTLDCHERILIPCIFVTSIFPTRNKFCIQVFLDCCKPYNLVFMVWCCSSIFLVGPTFNYSCLPSANAAGLLTMIITESPRRNILLTYRSLLTAFPRVFPFPPLLFSVHISFTSSRSLQKKKKYTEEKHEQYNIV